MPPLKRGPASRRGRDWQVEERLIGLLLVVIGLVGLLGVGLLYTLGLPAIPGAPPGFTAANPLQCLLPLVALGSIGLVLVGVWRVVSPD